MENQGPVLISGVITHLGELSPGIISLVEQLTAVAGKQCSSRSPLSRGLSKAKVTAAFRQGSRTHYEIVQPVYSKKKHRFTTGPGALVAYRSTLILGLQRHIVKYRYLYRCVLPGTGVLASKTTGRFHTGTFKLPVPKHR